LDPFVRLKGTIRMSSLERGLLEPCLETGCCAPQAKTLMGPIQGSIQWNQNTRTRERANMTTAKEAHEIAETLMKAQTRGKFTEYVGEWNTLMLYLEDKMREEGKEREQTRQKK